MFHHQNNQVRRAFTLIELLVVISIIALLVGLLLPVLTNARAAGQLVRCLSNQRQLGIGMQTWTVDYNGRYPSYYYNKQDWSSYKTGTPPNASRLVWGDAIEDQGYLTEMRQLLTCPSFPEGNELPNPANPVWASYNQPHYGYNFNNIGRGVRVGTGFLPARSEDIMQPADTYLLMDAVRDIITNNDIGSYVLNDVAGTGFIPTARHGGDRDVLTVAYADGHIESITVADRLTPYNELGVWAADTDNQWDRK